MIIIVNHGAAGDYRLARWDETIGERKEPRS